MSRTMIQSIDAQRYWRASLRQLAREIPHTHPGLFRRTPPEKFERAIQALDDAIPYMTSAQIVAGLQNIVALTKPADERKPSRKSSAVILL